MVKYDAIIVGSGQAANPLAKKLADAGWKTALIEKKFIGGTCLNVGCTPTKTLIASGRIAYLVKRSADFGIHTTGYSVNIEEVIRRKNEHVVIARESSAKSLLETSNLDVVFGNAMFSGPKEITVTKKDGSVTVMTAEKIFLNTGARPVVPPIPGLADVPYLTSDTIIDLPTIPTHLAIIGGSYIALEFGQLYRRLGSEVTIIEGDTRFLRKEDEDIAAEIKNILEEDGIHIQTGTKVERVSKEEKGIRLQLSIGTIEVSHVLVAAGRAADTSALQPAVAGITLNAYGFIAVNDKLETNIPGVYALGDVNGGPQFTHIAYNDHLIVYKNLFEEADCSTKTRPPVYCLFTDPELGRIGLTEKEARDKGMNIKVATLKASHIARAWENDETRGLLKAIVNADDKTIVGAAMLSFNGGELMSLLQMAMMGRIPYDVLRDGVFAHPTFAESLNNLFSRLQ
ncbi:mercuric reductase [Puia sp.]|jgi:pyruvate/2-oxoglutarate dehydrogenase complex dihydrolipoamide dehydrogenase (E3) component|uniref:mercuric reductase n=1 Tax=Puia sp. TaxID=2045100 RepID=UPI002F41B55B